jgi:hypothetical protein
MLKGRDTRCCRRRLALATLLAWVAMAAAPLGAIGAQDAAPRNVLSIQPLGTMFQTFAGEYERAVGKALTLGVGGTYWAGFSGSDFTYTSGELKIRYYPNEAALQGFSVGASLGFSTVRQKDDAASGSASGPTVGVLLEYQWLMGEKKHFALALGVGAKSLSISRGSLSESFGTRYPTARISIGYAF